MKIKRVKHTGARSGLRVTRPAWYVPRFSRRIWWIGALLLTIASLLYGAWWAWGPVSYELGTAQSLLQSIPQPMAKRLQYDATKQVFTFDNGRPQQSNEQAGNVAQVQTTAHKDASKGVTLTDPATSASFTMKPVFATKSGQQQQGHIVYPLGSRDGWLVYSVQGTGLKEDIILEKKGGDSRIFRYHLELGKTLEAKLESDGSVGIYGNTLLSGNITASTDADAALLQKAREKSQKSTLLFRIPKPFVVESSNRVSRVASTFSLNGSELTLTVTGLKDATYPLSIDPSIYVASAQQFMFGNNETNINFNVENSLIEKGRTTGARFDTWNATTSLPTASWGGSTVAAGGYIYTVGGTSFNGQIFNTQGAATFTVPAGITSLTFKMWGGGGAGGGGGNGGLGGAGGGGGYTTGTVSVTPGETLTVYVGGGGTGGSFNNGGSDAGGGGGGGGYSSLYRGSTPLSIAGGGGGGGGARVATTGGAGGAAGGTTGVNGSTVGNGGGGGGGTASAGGSGGTGGNNPGSAGISLSGGAGADGRSSAGADGSGAAGGLATGADGGQPNINTTRPGGGGGGAGWYGGGGGGSTTNANGNAGGGGGGGSSYIIAGATSTTNSAGSGVAPGNPTDSYRGNAGNGGTGGPSLSGSGGNGSNGLVVVTYGSGSTTVSSAVNWAQFNTSTGTIDSANPGTGVCSGWCTTNAYNLPSPRTNFSLVAYNGFLFALGGIDGTGARSSAVYVAKIGANGEPQLWHPTDTNKNNWVYWYQAGNLSSVRSDASAIAYNNRLYLVGGLSTSGAVNTMEYADINPNGTLGSWTGGAALPSALYGHSAQVYNDRLYIIGGASSIGGAPLSSVYYNKLNANGSMNSWVATTSLSSGRMSAGGNFSVVWGAYIYVSGGCSAVNASGYCTNILSDTDVASINADGSIDTWNDMAGVSSQRTGAGLVAWRDRIYTVGGCSAQNSTTGNCSGSILDSILYGTINQDGDASTVGQTVPVGTAPCSGGSPSGCNMPGTTYIGNILNSAIISNGYLYLFGGCLTSGCGTTSANTAYTAISSTGTMTAPTCTAPNTLRGNIWCVDTTNTISGGIAAASPVVFNGRIYLVGGLDGGGNTNTLLRNTLNSNGSLGGAWQTQSLTGLGMNSVSYQYAYARANPTDATNNPGNLYMFGGCSASSSMGCTSYSPNVYKCNIQAAGAIAGCTTSGQLQIDAELGITGTQGLGIMSGTVYANYIYLIGGVTPNSVDLKTVRYARIDNNNNIVAVNGSAWTESPHQMAVGRRRSAAFGYNGYLYAVGGYEASTGVLADIEFIKINVSDGSLGTTSGGWHVSAIEINQRWGLTVPVSNSFAYVIGGCTDGASPTCNSGGPTDVIQTFQVYNNDSGAPAGYSNANSYTTNQSRIGGSSTILNGYIYMVGGCTGTTDCNTTVNTVSSAPIDANGNIGAWTNQASLPASRGWGKLLTAGGSVYYVGGQDSSGVNLNTIYYATPSSGTISAWSTASNGLPNARSRFGATVWNNRIYIVGGRGTGTGCTPSNVCNTVYMSPQLNAGGNITSAWSTASSSFEVARSGPAVVSYANNLYVFGGYDGANYLSDSQYSQISVSNGTAGTWSRSESLPSPLSESDAFAANGYIYLLGGRSNATTCGPVTLVAPVSANTTIASGNNPTGIGTWYETNQRFSGGRYGAAATYYDGRAYILGGGCGSSLTYPAAANTVQQTTLLSQPQVAKYSIMMDTDSNVFPSSWLLNGLDNSIGARWQLKYRSQATCIAMTTWGQETNHGNVTLGLPGSFTPKDASGNNTNCGARYYYFNVTVDSSQAFGYPDDVTRGPTITDLTLQFTADPAKRLMHGRTFTGGLQQPDDTPYYQY